MCADLQLCVLIYNYVCWSTIMCADLQFWPSIFRYDK